MTSDDLAGFGKSQKSNKLLFQVDINLDNKIVRIGIHDGDDIDETVEKFGKMFGLKLKQEKLLKKRLKQQLEAMNISQ